jgi:hypothetical protein
MRARGALLTLAVAVIGLPFSVASGANLDLPVLENPRAVALDRASENRWQAIFEPAPRWLARQLAFLELRQPERIISLLSARLLYRGEPWTRRSTDTVGAQRWRQTNVEVRGGILRTLRAYRDPVLGDVLCALLAVEDEPGLVASALVDLHLVDPASAPAWALRLADPRTPNHLPGSVSGNVRQRCLTFLVQTVGIDAPQTRQALQWALMHTAGVERNHAIVLIPPGQAGDLLVPGVLRLAEEHRAGQLDQEGKAGLVLATTRLSGTASRELVAALMDLVVHADRAVATSAASALASGVSWDAAVAVNDLAERARTDPDPVIRQSLTALLMRLYPADVPAAAGPDSPWTELAHHQERLQAWEWERVVK